MEDVSKLQQRAHFEILKLKVCTCSEQVPFIYIHYSLSFPRSNMYLAQRKYCISFLNLFDKDVAQCSTDVRNDWKRSPVQEEKRPTPRPHKCVNDCRGSSSEWYTTCGEQEILIWLLKKRSILIMHQLGNITRKAAYNTKKKEAWLANCITLHCTIAPYI